MSIAYQHNGSRPVSMWQKGDKYGGNPNLSFPGCFASAPSDRKSVVPLFSESMMQNSQKKHSVLVLNAEKESYLLSVALPEVFSAEDLDITGSLENKLLFEENKRLKVRLVECEKDLVEALSTIRAMKKSFNDHLKDKREKSRLVIESKKRENRLKGELYLINNAVEDCVHYIENEEKRASFELEWREKLMQPEIHSVYGCSSFVSTHFNPRLRGVPTPTKRGSVQSISVLMSSNKTAMKFLSAAKARTYVQRMYSKLREVFHHSERSISSSSSSLSWFELGETIWQCDMPR